MNRDRQEIKEAGILSFNIKKTTSPWEYLFLLRKSGCSTGHSSQHAVGNRSVPLGTFLTTELPSNPLDLPSGQEQHLLPFPMPKVRHFL